MQARPRITVPCCTVLAVLFTCVVSAAAVRPEAPLLAFTDIGAGLPGVSTCSLAWGDYDNDGDLDLALAGDTGAGRITRIYRNDGGGVFTDVNAGLPGVSTCSLAWGDYDNDGDLDLALAGDTGAGRITRIYRNDGGGVFTDVNADLPGVSACSLAWGDYDNDGDLDILLAGNTGSSRITKIYRNDNDGFTDIGASLVGVDNCSVAWGDFDNDGDLDVLIAGNLAIKVYRNDSGTFTDIGAALTGVNWCSVAWGDFDNDGDLDLVIAGWATTGRIAKVYRNNAGVFVDVGAGLPGVYNCSVAWGDFDNDGDLDLLLAGDSTGGRIARIYSNSGPPPNTTAGAPASLRVRWDQGNDPILVWDPATDAETPSSGLTYNIRVGTSSGTDDVIPAMADCSNGYRRLPGLGNTGNSRTRFVLGTDPDSYYYWSVQAIDTAWAGGTWATEQRFRRLDFPTVITHPVTNIGYSSAVCGGEVLDEGASSVTNKGLVWATNQYPVVDNCLGKTDHGGGLGAFSDKLTNLVAGQTYYVRAYAVNSEGATYGEPKVFTTYTAVFTDIGAALAGVQNAAVAWGDYDNDGDLDLALAGDTGAGRITRICRNDGGGIFTDVTAGLPGVSACSLAWGDYDNDGDLDLALAGDTGAGRITSIYRNDGGGVFTDITAGLPGVSACSLAWGDYDNDGDLDLVAAGNTGAARIARIYRNDDGVFTDIGAAALTGVDVCSAAWGDYDNDGDLDLLLAGYTGAAYITRLYRNAGGVFVDTGAGLIGVGDCSVAWGDYDNDGDLDILLAGWSGAYQARVYRNDSGVFFDIGAGLTGLRYCSVAWGDYDNDGDLDILMAGATGAATMSTTVYRNGSGVFMDAGLALPGVRYCSVAWGDYDNAGDLDILLAGDTGTTRITRIYRNNLAVYNTTPTAPSGLTSKWNGDDTVFLSWRPAGDAETPTNGLTYNLRVGTAPGHGDVVPAMANSSTGKRQLPFLGNVNQNRGWLLRGLDDAKTYYWSVQAVDQALAGGTWASEGTFVLPDLPEVSTWAVSNIHPTSAECGGEVTDEGATPVSAKGLVWHTIPFPSVTNFMGRTDHGPGPGVFGDIMTNLVTRQVYYVRAYAINADGIVYGEQWSFIPEWFTDTGISLLDVSSGSAVLGDYDNDGDLDLALAGDTGAGRITRIYRNDGGNIFTDVDARLPGVSACSLAWGDYDNDGDLDLALAGDTGAGRITRIYRNDGGESFTDVDAGLPGVSACSLAWGDYDNDGDLDLALAGDTGAGRITRIYRNDGEGVFVDVGAGLPGVSACSLVWGDYDNDGDLDLVVAGNTGVARIARIYRNDDGVFTDIGAAPLTGVDVCSVAWGDYDTDGDLDLLLAGYTGAAYITRLYRNADGVFVDTGAGLIGVGDCSVAWGDYDNDGDLDILLAGWSGAYQARVYRNDIGVFVDSGAGLPGVRYASVAWGDFNNDGHLDPLLVGDTGVGRITKLYRNNGTIPNTPPTAPSSLAVESVSPAGAILTWTSATDAQTPWRELSYNLRIGTIPGGEDVKPAMADTASGLRRLPALGNVQQVLRWLVRDLSPTGYYQVAVQAVDSAWAGGEWSDEITLRLADYPVVVTHPVTNIGVNSALCGGEVTDEGASAVTSKGLLWHTTQRPTLTNYTGKSDLGPGGGSFEYKMTNLVANQTYFVRAYAVNDKGVSYGEDQRFTTLAEWCTDIGAPLLGVKDGAALWGDFDNDGDLDILLAGNLAPTRLYRNDEGAFTNVAASFVALNYASAAWGDYDNDGDLDLFLCGLAITVRTSKLYRNEGGGKFVEASVAVPGVYLGSAAWGDCDNDGDLDLVVAGNSSVGRITRIYRNDAGVLVDSGVTLVGIESCSVAWGDYDNDGDLDLIVAGSPGSGSYVTRLYRNDGNMSFVDSGIALPGVAKCSVAWGDYDNDGDLDLVLTGVSSLGRVTGVYRNDGSTFTDIGAAIPGIESGSVAWGDYDNDGDLDLVLTGNTGAARITKIFRNDNGIFRDSGISLTGLSESSVAWGDYDGDRDVDILLAGYTGSAAVAKVYRVNCGDPNTPPRAPTGLVAEDLGSEIRLTWNAASDAETPASGLSYNLRIGTAPGLDNIKPAMAAQLNGYRRIPALGNTHMHTGWTIKGLTRGVNYYCSVQAVDSAWIGGAWASERLIRLSSAPMDWYADCTRLDDEGSGWSWETAKKTIQAALAETRDGDRVWVAEGTYDLGGMPAPGNSLLNRICVTNAVTVRSVAGPEKTFIAGVPPDGTNDPVRCVYVGANALLAGFTLTAGRTAESGSVPWDTSGGGALLTDGVLSNCIIRLNTAHDDGGGAALWGGGRIELSWIEDNSTLTGRGGGVYLHNGGTVRGCLIAHNSASTGGGGAYLSGPNGTIENSTLTDNSADEGGGVFCSAGGTVLNSIIWDNSATTAGSNWVANGGGTFAFCATRPITGLPGGQGCTEEDPRFKNPSEGNYRLRYGSPCIDSGSNLAAVISFDLDGTTRPLDGNDDGTATFDMGVYEYDLLTADSNGDGIPDWWYHRYSLDPNDPEVSNGNPDGDAYSTGQEYIADTDPTNAASFFSIESVSNAPVWTVCFRSSAQRQYRLLYTATLTNIQWFAVEGQSNVWGNGELLGLRDPEEAVTNRYYRVGVSLP